MYKLGRGETSKRGGEGVSRDKEGGWELDDPRPLFTTVLPLFHYWPVEERQVGKGVTVTNCRKGDHDMPPLVNLIGFAPRLPMQSLLHDLSLPSCFSPSPFACPIFRFLSGNGARFLWTAARDVKRASFSESGSRSRDFYRSARGIGKRSRAKSRAKMSNERGDDFSMRSPRSKCREIQPGWLKIYQSSSPSLSPARNDFSGRAPSFLTALYVHALVTLKCRGSIFARLVQFPITRTLLVLEKARWSLSIAVHSARVIPFFSLLSISISLCRARTLARVLCFVEWG